MNSVRGRKAIRSAVSRVRSSSRSNRRSGIDPRDSLIGTGRLPHPSTPTGSLRSWRDSPPDFQRERWFHVLEHEAAAFPLPEKIRFSFGDGGRIAVPRSTLSNLRFGIRLHFVSEIGVVGLFQEITRLSTPLPRNASRSLSVSLRTSPHVPVPAERAVFRNAWAGKLERMTNRGEHQSPLTPALSRRTWAKPCCRNC